MTAARRWIALTVVACVAVALAGWFFLISPRNDEAQSLRDQAASQQQQAEQLKVKIASLKQQALGLPAELAKLKAVRVQLPEGPQLSALIRNVTEAAGEAGVQLQSIAPGTATALVAQQAAPVQPAQPAQPADGASNGAADGSGGTAATPAQPAAPAQPAGAGVYTIPVTLTVNGTYAQVQAYLARLEHLDRAFVVSAFSFAPGQATTTSGKPTTPKVGQSPSLTTTITAAVFSVASSTNSATTAVAAAAGASS
ncbi:MAG: hypothetical protein ACTHK1_17080 [Actinomycetales bacterium]